MQKKIRVNFGIVTKISLAYSLGNDLKKNILINYRV